jgi:RNA polymerase sigma factor (sigma-70 family)
MQKEEKKKDFERVYNEVFPVLMRVAYHITGDIASAEDICQDAFIRYYNRLVPLPDIKQAKYWLIRVVKNLAYNVERRKGTEKRALETIDYESNESEQSVESEFMLKETRTAIRKALQKLPYTLRSVLVLREYGGLNYREIAKVLRITEGNVKVRVYRAREYLGELLKEGYNVS